MHATKFRALTFLVAACLVTTGLPGWSRADDHGIAGLTLILIDKYIAAGKAKAVFVSHDLTAGGIHNGSGSGNPADLSGTVQICPSATPVDVAARWPSSALSARTPAPVSPAACARGW